MKLVLGSIIVLSVVVWFLFALFPDNISVSRLVRINQNKEQVKKTIADLEEWRRWNVFVDTSAFITRSSEGVLRSSQVSIRILRIKDDTIFTKWQNGEKSFLSDFVVNEVSNQVVVEWTMHFHLRWYPWEKLAGMFYEKRLGPQMEQSLINLQQIGN